MWNIQCLLSSPEYIAFISKGFAFMFFTLTCLGADFMLFVLANYISIVVGGGGCIWHPPSLKPAQDAVSILFTKYFNSSMHLL